MKIFLYTHINTAHHHHITLKFNQFRVSEACLQFAERQLVDAHFSLVQRKFLSSFKPPLSHLLNQS